MGYWSMVDSGEMDEGASASKPQTLAKKVGCTRGFPTVLSALAPSSEKQVRKGKEYTTEERSRGGTNCSAKRRGQIHDAIEKNLPIAIALRQQDMVSFQNMKLKFVMAHFIRDYVPQLTDAKSATRRYGEFIKAKLKLYEDRLPVMNLGNLIDKLRAGYAKRKSLPVKPPLFASMKGVITRLSSNEFNTSCKRRGGDWLGSMRIWAYFTDTETGECFT